MTTFRQQHRAHLRRLAGAALSAVVRLPRRLRRAAARAYSTGVYRDLHAMRAPWHHRYRRFHLNPQIRAWVAEKGVRG